MSNAPIHPVVADLARFVVDESPAETAVKTDTTAFVITKNQPERLKLSLACLAKACNQVYVLDSSNNRLTKQFCSSHFHNGRLFYHGPKEQALALKSIRTLRKAAVSGFVTAFSDDSWDVWSKRNYILLLATLLGLPNILIADDDIISSDRLVSDVVRLSHRYTLVGAGVAGMPDLSIVDHICTLQGISRPSFVSGQFLAMNVSAAAEYFFPNVYNEDWIFILRHAMNSAIARCGQIFQLYWNPFEGTQSRADFEERGEVLVGGLIRAITMGKIPRLEREDYWEKILIERRESLERLNAAPVARSIPDILSILQAARNASGKLTPLHCAHFWRSYEKRLTKWRSLIEEARSAEPGTMGSGLLSVC